MSKNLDEEFNKLEVEKRELERFRAELEYDQKISAELGKRLANINEAIVLISDKLKKLEEKLASLSQDKSL